MGQIFNKRNIFNLIAGRSVKKKKRKKKKKVNLSLKK